MAEPQIKLAASLEILRDLQETYGKVIRTDQLSRTHRERLVKNRFLQKINKQWYVISNPNMREGDTTIWYTSFWEFCKRYLEDRYGEDYCLTPEQSILLHAGRTTIPEQLIVRAPNAPNLTIPLLHDTSLYILKSNITENTEIEQTTQLRVMSKEEAVIHMSPVMYSQNPIEVRTVLADISNPAKLLRVLLEGSHSVIAGRLVGAFRNIGNDKIARDIKRTMETADYKIRVTDPFDGASPKSIDLRPVDSYVNRIKLMWESMRPTIIDLFPEPPRATSPETYLKSMDEIFITDAYHSLSIENYRVSAELINKVRAGEWNLNNEEDRQHKDALAARGYWQAFQSVKGSVAQLYEGTNSGVIFDRDHGDWYLQLFQPSVTAGILQIGDLAGYRNNQVYISNSMHVPIRSHSVNDTMNALVALLQQEEHASVRSVLGHFLFVYIHPYVDGNGRIGRFLLNLMLASGGYPWTVIPIERRDEYMNALEAASVKNNIEPFARLVADLVRLQIAGSPAAKEPAM